MPRTLILLAAILAAIPAGNSLSAPAQGTISSISQRADLGFDMECGTTDYLALEGDGERFLKRQGFRVFNKVRAQRDYGVRSLHKLWIEGLDEQRRRIRVMSSSFTPTGYTVGLYTPPPTSRASALEAALLAFAGDQIGCVTSRVQRDENGEEARSVHDRGVELLEDWFRQLEDMRRN